MAYCTLDDILERVSEQTIIELTDDTGSGVVDQDKVSAAIARADKEIDAWCGRRYQVPFSSPPAIVGELSADLSLYFLYARVVSEIPEARKDAHKNVLRLLEKISGGQVSLGIDPTSVNVESHAEFIPGSPRTFTRDSQKGVR